MARKKRKIKKEKVEQTWDGEPCVVMASGPSLGWDDYADVQLIKKLKIRTVAVNNTIEVAPFADIVYAGDGIWWRHNHKKIKSKAQRWTCAKNATIHYGAKYRARFIKPGYNSGANAVELVANVFNANPIILLGFDASVKHGTHHHGDHHHTSNPNRERAHRWKPQFKDLRERTEGKIIYNCSRYSEIPYFQKRPLKDVLKELELL